MKFYETKFEEYITSCNLNNLHLELTRPLNAISKTDIDRNNVILYGPAGTGKYTQALKYIERFSPTGLKYERKMNINLQKKKQYIFKISDVHFEIDMELLGCNAKVLWNEIYKAVLDILSTRQTHKGIILCKNFHKIHNELLDIFYSYMQSIAHRKVAISFVFITESLSFIPDNVLERCKIIHVKRPTKSRYRKCIGNKLMDGVDTSTIKNIKSVYSKNYILSDTNRIVVGQILDNIENYEDLNYLNFRDRLYDIFIYNLDLYECLWEILYHFIEKNKISGEKLEKVQTFLFQFLKFYNNNYRPIYHLERFMFYLCTIVHGF